MNGYAYNADVYCTACGRTIIREKWKGRKSEVDDLDAHDSEQWPQPIFFGESDSPQHCGDCGEYLYGNESEEEEEER